MSELAQLLQQTPYQAYTYAYPHKMAYRPFEQPIRLSELWAVERRDALFLYIHIPFCEMRCGFCNLFTTANPKGDLETAYLDTLARQAKVINSALGQASFARMAIGGGTPTYLHPAQLQRLFDIAETDFGIDPHEIPVSVETSPKTADLDRLRVLRERGIDRISIGVQSFIEEEANAAGRPQRTAAVEAALERIRQVGFATLNIDLIYGLPGQTIASWLFSLRAALRYTPEELYLYPLYVRPLTGLDRQEHQWGDIRLACYRAGRELLIAEGYQQVSMRMFRSPSSTTATDTPLYCCQDDGMVGLGCGARSYTCSLHYSSEYAVGAAGVRGILHHYIGLPDQALGQAVYGFELDADDQRRRYIIQSLLQTDGMQLAAYRERFGTDIWSDLPQLAELLELDLALLDQGRLMLTESGLERSDTIGPWLYTPHVHAMMEAFELH